MKAVILLGALLFSVGAQAGRVFAGYDFGEMAFNEFKHFSGEMGYRFDDGKSLRLVHMNVLASEEHLSSDFARAVDGDNVEGLLKGVELIYTLPIRDSAWYWGPSVGYYEERFRHLQVDESLESESFTLGVAFGYRQRNLFGMDRAYYDLTVPIRYSFDSYDDTRLGETTVRSNQINNNIWFVVGVEF